MKNNTKLIMENWRKFLKEGPDDDLDLDLEPLPLEPEEEYLYDADPESGRGDFTEEEGYEEESDVNFETDEEGYSTNPEEFQPGREFQDEYLSDEEEDEDEFLGHDL